MNLIKRIIKAIPSGYKKKSLKIMILLFINSVMEMFGLAVFIPLFSVILQDNVTRTNLNISRVYEFIGFTSENQFILALAGLIVFVLVFKSVVSLLILRSQVRFSMSLHQYYAIRLHQFFYSKGFSFFKNTNSNIIANNVNVVSESFAVKMLLPIFHFLNEIFILLFIVVSLFLYDWKVMILLLCAILPTCFLFYKWVKNRSAYVETRLNKIRPLLQKNILESIFGYVDIQITNSEKSFRTKISHYLSQKTRLIVKQAIYAQVPARVIEIGMATTIFMIVAYGLFFLPNKVELATMLSLFALATYRTLPSINRIMVALVTIKGNQYLLDIISPARIYKHDEKINVELSFCEKIELRNISFQFSDSKENVLNNFSLTIKKGEIIGMMGTSGVGKTTLVNLLLGFYKVTKGQILIDGKELNDYTLKSWRDQIGYVQQDIYILDGTIMENIAFGVKKNNVDYGRLKQVLKQASLWNLIQTLPEKTDTNIGEGGMRFSGGQRQRIGIARTLYSGSKVLFFDEATSALDSETEQEITESIRKLSKEELTIFVIAHRESTLKYCDRIIRIA